MTSTPLPSSLVLLQDLATAEPLSKVRFLGCVVSYNVQNGRLRLQHRIRRDDVKPSKQVKTVTQQPDKTEKEVQADVNIELVTQNIDASLLSHGAWVNVLGIVEAPLLKNQDAKIQATENEIHEYSDLKLVHVQAQLLWSAGALDIEAYERGVDIVRKAAESK